MQLGVCSLRDYELRTIISLYGDAYCIFHLHCGHKYSTVRAYRWYRKGPRYCIGMSDVGYLTSNRIISSIFVMPATLIKGLYTPET